MLTSEEHRLLDHVCKTWAETHAKASLAVFAMLALRVQPQWAGQLQQSLREMTGDA